MFPPQYAQARFSNTVSQDYSSVYLLSQSKPSYQGLIASPIFSPQIGHQSLSPTYQLIETTLGVVIMAMLLKVLSQLPDASGNNGNLHLGRARVPFMQPILLHNGVSLFLIHSSSPSVIIT
jgi:hypothetical protein